MKAVLHDVYGPPEQVLRLDEIDRPEPGPAEVLIRVRAASVDAGVWHLTTGLPYAVRAAGFGQRAPKLRVRGTDVSGEVVAVGAGTTRLRVGDEVYGTCAGAFAEYACGPETRLAHKPVNLDHAQAAAVPVSGCTALQALRDRGRLRAGQRVLIIGAAGGVGSFAVQIAKALGAHVTGVCSSGKVELVRAIGADEVLDYRREDPTDGSRRYDLVLDTAGNRPLSRLRRALTPNGTLVIVGGETPGRWVGGADRQLRALLLTPFVGQRLRTLASSQHHDDLELLTELIESGAVNPVVDRSYPLAEVPQAVGYQREGHAAGKVVVRV